MVIRYQDGQVAEIGDVVEVSTYFGNPSAFRIGDRFTVKDIKDDWIYLGRARSGGWDARRFVLIRRAKRKPFEPFAAYCIDSEGTSLTKGHLYVIVSYDEIDDVV